MPARVPHRRHPFVQREAAAYDEAAVKAAQAARCAPTGGGARARKSAAQGLHRPGALAPAPPACAVAVQIKLAPVNAPWFQGAHLLVAADCTAYAYADFHNRFMRRHVTLIGCPKLDGVDYAEKLTAILRENEIKSVTVVRMEVPCCGGLEQAVKTALQASGKFIPWQVAVISTEGNLLEL
ncbi:MAG: ferredoxin [Ruthenibacterium sp.]